MKAIILFYLLSLVMGINSCTKTRICSCTDGTSLQLNAGIGGFNYSKNGADCSVFAQDTTKHKGGSVSCSLQ